MKFDYNFYRVSGLIRAFSLELFGIFSFDFNVNASEVDRLSERLLEAYMAFGEDEPSAVRLADEIALCTPTLRSLLTLDAESIYAADPAADSLEEIIACYPGFFATLCHRLAHKVYETGHRPLSRLIAEYAHSLTGVDIHPGASIGRGLAIDHGTGLVIGETAVIGDNVRLYQGVTVGAKSFPRGLDGGFDRAKKRHPTIGDRCTVYANATILGADTVVGSDSVIGANVWLTYSVPPGTVVHYERK